MRIFVWGLVCAFCLTACYNTSTSPTVTDGTKRPMTKKSKLANPFKHAFDDQAISYKVSRALAKNPNFSKTSRVAVSTLHQNVLLIGQVPDLSLKQEAQTIAATVPNVRRIFNEITIGPPIDIYQQGRDSLVTLNVKSRLLATDTLRSGKIRVITENGVVYLMGVVTHAQGTDAAQIAANSTGVKGVIKTFEYTN